MRQLTRKQKNLLNKWINEQKDPNYFNGNRDVFAHSPFIGNNFMLVADDVPEDLYLKLEEINDSEILYQEVGRYVYDQSQKIANGQEGK